VTFCPAARSTIWSLGVLWQSVERHHVSPPLEITNFCVLVPTLSVQSSSPVLVRAMDSWGFCLDEYESLSVTGSTSRSAALQAGAVTAVDDGLGVGATVGFGEAVGVGVGVTVGEVTTSG